MSNKPEWIVTKGLLGNTLIIAHYHKGESEKKCGNKDYRLVSYRYSYSTVQCVKCEKQPPINIINLHKLYRFMKKL